MTTIQLRRGTAAAWTAANSLLAAGELGIETDTSKVKIGDGLAHWNALAYFGGGGGTGDVVGPAGATNSHLAVFDGVTGKLIKDGGAAPTGSNTGDQTITLTSDVTGSGTGSFATTIANAAVTLAKMANMATASLFYRKSAGSGPPEVNTLATLKTDLALTKSDVGLSNVDNTSDANKPVSTAQQAALDLKANIASPTFTGTVGGITAGMVGLGNVDNTSDVNKPVSTAQQAALDLKAPLASPALTGSPTAPTATVGDASTLIATTAFVAAAFDSPELTGIPTAPTLDVGDDSDAIATTAFVHNVLDNQATFDPWQVATVPADSYRWGQV